MANDFSRAAGCVAVYNFESITAGGNIVASASSEASSTYAAWKAFERAGGYWSTTAAGVVPCWLALSWGSGNEKVVSSYVVSIYSIMYTEGPRAWTMEGYNGSSWVTLDTQTGQTWTSIGEAKTFSVPNTTAYEAYRLNISANNGGTTTRVNEFALYGLGGVRLSHPFAQNTYAAGACSDSKGTNHLTAVGRSLPAVDDADFKQGEGSIDLESTNDNFLFRSDANLSSSFPWKYGTTNYSFSSTCWVKLEDALSGVYDRHVWAKDMLGYTYGHTLIVSGSKVIFRLQFAGAVHGLTADVSFAADRWYFIAVTYDVASGAARLYVWDDTDRSVAYNSTANWSAYGNPRILGGDWIVGSHTGNTANDQDWDGLLDELTVWNRALTTDEIERIRDGLYYTPYSEPPAIFFSQRGYEQTLIYKPALWMPKFPAVETLSWKTGIIKPKDTSREQRIALRTIPRQGFKYRYQIPPGTQRSLVEAQIFNNLKKKWGVPVWHEHVHHDGTLAAGSTSIAIDTRYADFRNSSYGVVYDSDAKAEVIRIATKSDSVLNLAAGLVNTYIGDKLIAPMRFGYVLLPPRRIRDMENSGYDLLEVQFGFVDNVAITGHFAPQSYDGLDVLLRAHSLSQELTDVFDPDAILEDNETGLIQLSSYSDFNIVNQSHAFYLDDRQDVWEFRQWLHSIYGMQKPFLVPTFIDDLTLSRTLTAGDMSVYIANCGLSAMGVNAMRTYLAFEQTDGTLIVRKITNIAEVSTAEEVITINAATGVQFASGSPAMFVDRCRLGSDDLEIEHREDGDAVCVTGFTRIEV